MIAASRKHLTPDEVERLIDAAGKLGRHGHRDATLILIAYRHGLRVSELVSLRWEQVNFKEAVLHVRRLKNGTPATHPLQGPTMRALRRVARDYPSASYVFLSERGAPLSPDAIQAIVLRAGEKAGLPVRVHPHALRHSTGYRLASTGADLRTIQAYLGHRNVSNTVIYTALSPTQFRGLWRD